MLDTGLKDQVAIVTGANHGIGAATARALAAQGVAVFLTYLRFSPVAVDRGESRAGDVAVPGRAMYRARQEKSADEVVATIRREGGKAVAWEADLRDPATMPLLFDRAEAAFGPVSVLVNNAAHSSSDTFVPPDLLETDARAHTVYDAHPVSAASHDDHFAVNSRAVALMMAEFARHHVARGATWGRIVNVSTDGATSFPGEVSYGASKYALESYSRSAAAELGRYGITVNVVSLGPIQTGWITPELAESVARATPLGRVGEPEDAADAIVLLASHQARWITGQLLYVGGGHTM
jgi:3-oxoacyl-[acyl-carrier protein] reductase